MGSFRIEIQAVGGHGVDRTPKEGERVNFYKDGINTPDATAKQIVDMMTKLGYPIESAKLIHWPGDAGEVVDDLLSDTREKGNF